VSPVVCSSDGKSIASREAYPGAMVQVGAGAVILDAGRDLRLDKTSTRPWDRIATFSRSDRVTAPQSAEENTPVNSESDRTHTQFFDALSV
jgi:hypothetical protein